MYYMYIEHMEMWLHATSMLVKKLNLKSYMCDCITTVFDFHNYIYNWTCIT